MTERTKQSGIPIEDGVGPLPADAAKRGGEPAFRGLDEGEALARLREDGPNEIGADGHSSFLAIVLNVFREPMLMLLLIAGGIYLLLGDIHEALILILFAGLSILITVVQEGRTEKAIEALRDYSVPQVRVLRAGAERTVPARELVRGDLMFVAEGDRIAADGWLVVNDAVQADESVLTGESVPVAKVQAPADAGEGSPAGEGSSCGGVIEAPVPGGDGLPYVYSGALMVRGSGLVRVAATGARSAIGQIGQSLATLDVEAPRLSQQTGRLVRWFAVFGIGVSVLATVLYALFRGGWLDAILAGIALGMSMLPEEFPVVLAVFMAMGALRMSRARVLTRRGSAIESLGAATILCTDKTGTLTQNRMEIAALALADGEALSLDPGKAVPLSGAFVELAGLGVLACAEQPFDPMEIAFHDLDRQQPGEALEPLRAAGWTLRRHYPITPELLAMTHVWGRDGDVERIVATKGAPEAIADLCALPEDERARMDAAVRAMAERGLRVLGVAEARWDGDRLPETQRPFPFRFRGLVGLADPIRERVPDAVRQLQHAGIRVVMITGDYPATARAIAAQAGIRDGAVMSGEELADLDDAALAERVGDVAVFARVMPDQKLRIVQALKARGEIVAMTGDGVNDAPSLKAAHIGIAMGGRGTDVAREASAIVLLDDDFGSIVSAVRLGRRIYDNLRKAMGFIVAVHLPIGGLALLPLLTGWPILLGPLHIALLEMIIDPVCSLVFEAEPEEDNILSRPPRHPDAPLFSRKLVMWSVIQGGLAILILGSLVAWTQISGMGAEATRAIAFGALVLSLLTLVFVNRAFGTPGFADAMTIRRHRNIPLLVILILVTIMLTALFTIPGVEHVYRVAALDGYGLALMCGAAALLFGVLSLIKRFFRTALQS